MVVEQPAGQNDQDQCPRCPSRPGQLHPTGRVARRQADGAHHPRRDLLRSNATAMRITAIYALSERKRQDIYVRCAETRRCWARIMHVPHMIRPAQGVWATAEAGLSEKRLSSGQSKAILASDGRPLRESR